MDNDAIDVPPLRFSGRDVPTGRPSRPMIRCVVKWLGPGILRRSRPFVVLRWVSEAGGAVVQPGPSIDQAVISPSE